MKLAATQLHRQSGLSYVEVLIAALLIVISLAPMMDAMRGATTSSGIHEDSAVRHTHLLAKMEEVLSEPFTSLAVAADSYPLGGNPWTSPTSYSDAADATNRRLVFVAFSDGDNDDPTTGTEADLIWVRTEIEGTLIAVETLVYR